MPAGVFVTGTDTGVGKTVVAATLVRYLRRHVPVRYWKPIQTGIEQDDDTAEVARLAAAIPEEVLDEGVRLRRPVSPHAAAQASGCVIDVDGLLAMFRRKVNGRRWVVEGAGGVLVPLTEREMMVDLMARLALPTVVAARTAVGTINHTLMTLEVLRHRAVEIAGVVMVGAADDAARRAIETYGGVEVLGELPRVTELTCQVVDAWSQTFDRAGHLLARLG